MRKILKMIGLTLLSLVVLILIIGALFLNLSPQFGKGANTEQKVEYAKSGHYKDGVFQNQSPTTMDIHYWALIKEMLKKAPHRKPGSDITVEKINAEVLSQNSSEETKLSWFGHSSFLLEMDGKKILIDPMFSKSPSPLSFIGTKRYSNELPIEIEMLPYIDAIIISHDHYDHLDYESIQALKGKVGQYYTPLGVGNHLIAWGIEKEKINELNWWDSINLDSIKLVCTPARHFSGRGLFDRSTTLWCSWVIEGKQNNVFYSADGGYDTHFKDIGDKYGPFDISLMECGQYHSNWKSIHMMPEETVQASIDLKSKLTMPIHWGAFSLALHDWTDPIERVTKKANELGLPLTTPRIGETIIIGSSNIANEKWWREYI